jgi:HEAT repeat protein
VQHASAGVLLCEMLQDDESRVRQSAVWSLAALDDVTVLPRLRTLLFEDRGFRARPADERDDFFRTYGRIADTTTFDELVRTLDQKSLVSVGWQNELRRGAALALGETGKSQAARLLQEHASSRDARLRDACAAALQSLRARGREAAAPPQDDTWHPARKPEHQAGKNDFRLEVDDAF